MTDSDLIAAALSLTGEFRPARKLIACEVACALVTQSGDLFTGTCIVAPCGLGSCAEHAAIAEMLKARQSRIASIVAVELGGSILPPCGRCRELLWQIDRGNVDTRVLLGPDTVMTLGELLPNRYDERFD